MATSPRTNIARLGCVAAATLVIAACGGGESSSCVDFDADNPPMRDVDLVALSEVVTDLPESFENDPPVPTGLVVESVSEVTSVEAGNVELDVENGVSVVLGGRVSTAGTTGIYTSLVGACSESGTIGDGDSETRSVVGFTDDRAVRFYIEERQLTVSEYDR